MSPGNSALPFSSMFSKSLHTQHFNQQMVRWYLETKSWPTSSNSLSPFLYRSERKLPKDHTSKWTQCFLRGRLILKSRDVVSMWRWSEKLPSKLANSLDIGGDALMWKCWRHHPMLPVLKSFYSTRAVIDAPASPQSIKKKTQKTVVLYSYANWICLIFCAARLPKLTPPLQLLL